MEYCVTSTGGAGGGGAGGYVPTRPDPELVAQRLRETCLAQAMVHAKNADEAIEMAAKYFDFITGKTA